MSEYSQPFLWNFIKTIKHAEQTGSEEGFSKSTNEETDSSIVEYTTRSEEGLTESANEEISSTIADFVTRGEDETAKAANEDTVSKIVSVHYNKKIPS